MALEILKNTNQETVVKITEIGTETITLANLTTSKQVLNGDEVPTVNIVAASWSGLPSSTILVERNGTVVLPITGDQPQMLELAGEGYVDDVENTSDIEVTIATANAALYLTLRKVAGWVTTFEPAYYGSYDDETHLGPKDISGSPPPVGLFDIPAPGSGTFDTGGALTMTSAGTPYAPGDDLTTLSTAALGLWRKKYKGNFGTSPGSGIDVNFCVDNTGWFGKKDTYVSFGAQDIGTENYYTFEWVGYFKAPTTGTYNFWVTTDDDTYFWIGTNALEGNFSDTNAHLEASNQIRYRNTNSVNLTAGHYYPVRMQFGEYGGAEKCQILWGRTTDTNAVSGNDGTIGTQVWYHNSVTKGH